MERKKENFDSKCKQPLLIGLVTEGQSASTAAAQSLSSAQVENIGA